MTREMILKWVADTVLAPFEQMVGIIPMNEGLDESVLPDDAKRIREWITMKLTADRAGYEEVVAATAQAWCERHNFTAADIEAVFAFWRSEANEKIKAANVAKDSLMDHLDEAVGKWKNSTLEQHIEEFQKTFAAMEPAPAEAPAGSPPAEVPLAEAPADAPGA